MTGLYTTDMKNNLVLIILILNFKNNRILKKNRMK